MVLSVWRINGITVTEFFAVRMLTVRSERYALSRIALCQRPINIYAYLYKVRRGEERREMIMEEFKGAHSDLFNIFFSKFLIMYHKKAHKFHG